MLTLLPDMSAAYPQPGGTTSTLRRPTLVDIGVGAHPMPGAVGVDLRVIPGVAVAADAAFGLPFRTSSLDGIRASHVVEHMAEPLCFFAEAWRALRPGGTLLVITPHFTNMKSVWTDPTHRRPYGAESWAYLDASAFGNYADRFDFRVVATYLRRQTGTPTFMSSLIERLANVSPVARRRAEVYWAGLIGGFAEVQAFLTAVK